MITRQAVKEYFAVLLAHQSLVQDGENAAVFPAANQPAKSLLQRDDGLGDLVIGEGTAPVFVDQADPGRDDGVRGHGKREAINDDRAQLGSLDVHALPKGACGEENGVRSRAKAFEQSSPGRGPLQQHRVAHPRPDALIDIPHLLMGSEKDEGAPAGSLQELHHLLRRLPREIRRPWVRQSKRRVQQRLGPVVKVRFQDFFLRVVNSQPALDEIERAADRQGRRSQHNGFDALEQLFAEEGRNVDGRRLKKNSAPATLPPEDEVALSTLKDELEGLAELACPSRHLKDFLRRFFQPAELRFQAHQGVEDAGIGPSVDFEEAFAVIEAHAGVTCGKQLEEKPRPVPELPRGCYYVSDGGALEALEPERQFGIPRQLLHAVARDLEAEVLCGHVLDVVGLIEDQRGVIGQDTCELHLLQSQIGEKQVVIHDDDVRLGRPLVHPRNETPFELRAFLPRAQLPAGVNPGPEFARIRQFPEFRTVSGLGPFFPFADFRVLLYLFHSVQHRLFFEVVKFLAAQVVLPALHQGDAHLREQFFKERDILPEELFLKIFCAG